MKTCFARVILTLALIAALPLSTFATPPLNTPCTVQLRRDATGALSPNVAVRIAFSGKLKSVDKDWICLDSDEGGEVWIPMSSIQFIGFANPKS